MGLVFRFEVQVGVVVFVEDFSGRVVNDGIFGFVYFSEDIIQGFQFFGCEVRFGEKSLGYIEGGDERSMFGIGFWSFFFIRFIFSM